MDKGYSLSDSGADSSEFIQGLREMGLMIEPGVDQKDDSDQENRIPESESRGSPGKGTPSSKKMTEDVTPQRIPMDSKSSPTTREDSIKANKIDVKSDQTTPPKRRRSPRNKANRVGMAVNDFIGLPFDFLVSDGEPIAAEGPVESMEYRISEYLSSSITNVVNQVAMELSTLLEEANNLDSISTQFSTDLHEMVRELIEFPIKGLSFRTEDIIQFDPFPSDLIQKVAQLQDSPRIRDLESLKNSNLLVSGKLPVISDRLTEIVTNWTKDSQDLRKSIKNSFLQRINREKGALAINAELVSLEIKELEQKIEREFLETQKSRFLEQDRFGSPNKNASAEEVRSDLAELIAVLRTGEAHAQLVGLRSDRWELTERLESIRDLRRIFERKQRDFVESCHFLSRWRTSNGLSSSLDDISVHRVRDHLHFDDDSDGGREEVTEVSIWNLRDQLDVIEKKRSDNLASVSSFIEELDQREARRRLKSGRSKGNRSHI
jgi:hypothetical protein